MIPCIVLSLAICASPLGDALSAIRTANDTARTAGTLAKQKRNRKAPAKPGAPASKPAPAEPTEQDMVPPPDVARDIERLRRALHAMPDVTPDLVAEAPCASPAVYRENAKNECVVLDYGAGIGLAMLYYPQLRGQSPKPAKAYIHSPDGIWSEVLLGRP